MATFLRGSPTDKHSQISLFTHTPTEMHLGINKPFINDSENGYYNCGLLIKIQILLD